MYIVAGDPSGDKKIEEFKKFWVTGDFLDDRRVRGASQIGALEMSPQEGLFPGESDSALPWAETESS